MSCPGFTQLVNLKKDLKPCCYITTRPTLLTMSWYCTLSPASFLPTSTFAETFYFKINNITKKKARVALFIIYLFTVIVLESNFIEILESSDADCVNPLFSCHTALDEHHRSHIA